MSEIVIEINEQMALLRAYRHRPILRIRMHPLDIEYLRKTYISDAPPSIFGAAVLGSPVEPDDACERGKPIVDWHETE